MGASPRVSRAGERSELSPQVDEATDSVLVRSSHLTSRTGKVGTSRRSYYVNFLKILTRKKSKCEYL